MVLAIVNPLCWLGSVYVGKGRKQAGRQYAFNEKAVGLDMGQLMSNAFKGFFAIVLASASLFVSAQSASAGTETWCESKAYACTSMGYSGGDSAYTYSDWAQPIAWGYQHNCTMYIAWLLWLDRGYIQELNNLGNAGEWASMASKQSKLGVSVSNKPTKWSVAQWVSGNHVAFVEEVYFDPYGNAVSIVVTEDSLAKTTSKRRITPGDRFWPDNFINFGMTFKLSGGGGGGMVAYRQTLDGVFLP